VPRKVVVPEHEKCDYSSHIFCVLVERRRRIGWWGDGVLQVGRIGQYKNKRSGHILYTCLCTFPAPPSLLLFPHPHVLVIASMLLVLGGFCRVLCAPDICVLMVGDQGAGMM